MKKTFLGIVAITMLLVALLATSVNAASITADNNGGNIKKGDILTVKITTNQPVESMEFDLKYDNTRYEYLGDDNIVTGLSSVGTSIKGDVITVSAFGGEASTLSLQFKAIENGESVPFTVSNEEFTQEGKVITESFANPTVHVTIADPTPVDPTPVDPENPTPDVGEDDPSTEVDNNGAEESGNKEEYVNEDGEVITKIPQTGDYIPSIALGIIAFGAVVVTGYKMIKNK